MNKEMKNTRGITLIALVVSIIVLIILAGITIAALSGDNGILTRAKEAKQKTEQAQKEEEENITVAKQEILNHYAFMEELLTYGESKGKKYFSFVESYIPALSSRRCRE